MEQNGKTYKIGGAINLTNVKIFRNSAVKPRYF